MALLDFLKRKKGIEKVKKPSEKKPESLDTKKEAQTKPQIQEKPQSAKSKNVAFSYSVVKEPHISEKSTQLAENNSYVFRVYNDVNKPEIKKSVEGVYKVDVVSVNIVKIPAKKRRLGKTQGFKKGYTKAIVKIKEGQKIEIF